ncbi:MAG: hypothetical protein RBT69_05035 [Spirochaetia bacterium]|jgi:DNA polymerase-3 subunit gamma/tau|nr:hypothetical protein [Spirochaetia bacterium]
MFDNIIGHTPVIGQITKEFQTNTFPPAILVSGPLYCGKQTIALEAARVITCSEKANWNCKCESCRLNRVLSNPSVLLMGSDFFIPEIATSKKLLERKKEAVSCYLFIRSVRKLLRRFDPVFTEENDTRYKKISGLVNTVEQMLTDFDPEYVKVENIKDSDMKKADTILEHCKTIVKDYNFSGIPVDQIRKAVYWLRFSGYSSKKVIIVENAENMNDSSKNALLKILEEPPENTFFILLTSRPGEIIPTIKSRLRKYELSGRTIAENKIVIEKIFREESVIFTDLKSYLNSSIPEIEVIKKAAKQFVYDLFDNTKDEYGISPEVRNILKAQYSQYFPEFLEELSRLSSELLASSDFIDDSPDNLSLIRHFGYLINESYKGFDTFNINQELLVESMFLELKKRL